MSLLSPPPDVPANLVPIWPWIWLQHQILLAWIRLTYGRGYRYCWGVTHSGRVVLVCTDLDSRDRVDGGAGLPPTCRCAQRCRLGTRLCSAHLA